MTTRVQVQRSARPPRAEPTTTLVDEPGWLSKVLKGTGGVLLSVLVEAVLVLEPDVEGNVWETNEGAVDTEDADDVLLGIISIKVDEDDVVFVVVIADGDEGNAAKWVLKLVCSDTGALLELVTGSTIVNRT